MTDKQTIDLIIQTQLKGGRSLQEITQSIEKLEAALRDQAQAAERGEGSFKKLQAAQAALAEVQQELAARRDTITSTTGKLTAAVERQERAFQKAQKAFSDYQAKIKGDATAEQTARLEELRSKVDRQKAAWNTAAAAVEANREALRRAGADVSDLAADLAKVDAALLRNATAADRAKKALIDFADVNERAAQQAALLRRFQEGNAADARLAAEQQRKAVESVAQAEADRLAIIQRTAQAEQRQRGSDALAAEQAALREAADLQKRYRQELEQQAAASRRAEQAEADRLATLQRIAQAEQGQRGADALAAEKAALSEAAAVQRRYNQEIEAQAAAARKAEQAEADRLAIIQRTAQAEQQARGRLVAEGELQNIRDAEAALARYNEEKAKAAKRDEALSKSAKDAEDTALSYKGLARAAGDLTPRVQTLQDALEQMRNPGAAARTTLSGVSTEVQKLANEIAASGGKVESYRATLAQLNAAQDALSSQAGLIDNFVKQRNALQAAQKEFVSARDEVLRLAAALRQGGEGADALAKPLAEAQARLKAADAAIAAQVKSFQNSKQALADAGINTKNLADAQRTLTENTKRLTDATKQLNEAQKQVATPATPARTAGGGGFALFNDEGRTTLSLAQRIRGEILAMGAAFIGLYGVIDLARTSLQAYNAQQNLASTLGFAFGGDQQLVGQQLEYLREQADRIGVSYEAASKNFARFSAAAVKSGASVQETNFIFEAFAETGRVIGLTPDELNGIFNAIGQSFSKGKIQAEELRQQIGERLPGAFAFAQEALRKQFPDLNKALEEGKVGAENLVLIAESVRKAAAEQLPKAIQSLDAEQQRFNTSVLFFKKEIADAGFADAYLNLLKELQDFFRSEDGRAFAQAVGGAFASVADAVRVTIEVAREFSEVLKALGYVVALVAGNKLFGAIVAGLAAQKVAFLAASPAAAAFTAKLAAIPAVAGAATLALRILKGTLVALNVAAAAFILGTFLRDQFEIVELAGINLVINLQKTWTYIKFGAQELWEAIPILASNAFAAVFNTATRWLRDMLGIFGEFARVLGLDKVVADVNKALDTLTMRTQSVTTARTSQLRQQRAEELAQIEKIGREMMVDAIRRRQTTQAVATPNATATAFPGARSGSNNQNNDKAAEQAAKRRENEIEALNKQLDSLDARLDRAQGDNLARQLEAIDTQYRALAKRIAEIGGREAVDLGARWGTLYAEARNAAIEKFNEQRTKAEESLLSKIEQLEAQAGKKQEENLGRRIKAISDGQQALLRDLEAERDILVANGRDTAAIDELIRRAEAGKQALVVAEAEKFNKEELAKREKEINDILTVRKELIDQVKQAQQEGQITDVEAQDRIRAIVEQSQPRIDSVAESARIFAENLRGAVSDTAIDAFIAKLDAARNSGARLTGELNNTQRVIRDGLLNALDAGVGAAVDALSQMAMGTMKVGDAFKAMGRAALSVLAQVVRELAVAAIRASILRAITGGGGGPVSWGGEALSPTMHSGGVVGAVANRRRAVSPTWFANAPRYHSGGIVGLRPDEYPAILQRNEEVLSRSDPRNVMNGGLQPAAASSGGSVRVVLVDDPKRAAEQLAGADGEQVVMRHIRSNLPTLRTMLK